MNTPDSTEHTSVHLSGGLNGERTETTAVARDLEMTRLCAQAAEVWRDAHKWYPTMTLDPTFKGVEIRGNKVILVPNNLFRQGPQVYDPLHDDAQAMALVKRFKLRIGHELTGWEVWEPHSYDRAEHVLAFSDDLNRAIVECVVKMQASRATTDVPGKSPDNAPAT